MKTATADAATITISTTPLIGSGSSVARRATDRTRLVGRAARVIAGMTGVLLGLAIGLVSAGFDTTGLLLAVGGAAVGLGWIFAVVSGRAAISADRR